MQGRVSKSRFKSESEQQQQQPFDQMIYNSKDRDFEVFLYNAVLFYPWRNQEE